MNENEDRNLIMVITLKNSGVQLRFPVNSYTIKRDKLHGNFSGLDWNWDNDASSNLRYLDPDEIAAVHSEWE